MPHNRVSRLLAAYFNESYAEYARIVSGIKAKGGLTSEEINVIKSKVLYIDAATIIRQSGTTDENSLSNNPIALAERASLA